MKRKHKLCCFFILSQCLYN